MLAATNAEVKMSGREKNSEPKNAHDISSKERVTKKFLEVSRCSHAKQRQNQKSVLHVQSSCFFAPTPIVVFSPFSLPSLLSITPGA